MPRKPRPLDRDLGMVRDASLIVIASEDTYAVSACFARFRPRRVRFRVLHTEDGRSAPEHVVARLDQFKNEFQIGEGDQLWYCGDTDHWASGNHLPNLLRVLSHCKQAGYQVALSHPCFELWLLLHFTVPPPGIETCEDVCKALSALCGGYSKDRGCGTQITAKMVEAAVGRAKDLDTNTPLIPTTATTRIHRILQLLLDRELIVLNREG